MANLKEINKEDIILEVRYKERTKMWEITVRGYDIVEALENAKGILKFILPEDEQTECFEIIMNGELVFINMK